MTAGDLGNRKWRCGCPSIHLDQRSQIIRAIRRRVKWLLSSALPAREGRQIVGLRRRFKDQITVFSSTIETGERKSGVKLILEESTAVFDENQSRATFVKSLHLSTVKQTTHSSRIVSYQVKLTDLYLSSQIRVLLNSQKKYNIRSI